MNADESKSAMLDAMKNAIRVIEAHHTLREGPHRAPSRETFGAMLDAENTLFAHESATLAELRRLTEAGK